MSDSFEISTIIPAQPMRVYEAWLDGDLHGAMTGTECTGSAEVGARFTAGDGYIEGVNLELEPGSRLVQSWRTSEFDGTDPDSRLEVLLEPATRGTKLTLRHSNIPDGQGQNYESGWTEYYFKPMKDYFSG